MSGTFKYDENILKQLQDIETQMLKKLDEICMKYDIPYFILFGTAIGALRHKGFIPWDDDIDVGMMRSDYEKLKSVPKEEWGDLILSDPLDKNYSAHTLVYPQIYKKGTAFRTKYHSQYDDFGKDAKGTLLPIWLDIFLFDHVESVEEAKKKSKKAFMLQKYLYYSKSRIKVLKNDPLKRKIMCFAKRMTHDILNIKQNCSEKIYKKYLDLVTSNEGDYITSFDLEFKHEMINICTRFEDAFPTVRIPFGDITVSIQKNYDESLKNLYGDYMSMPPKEARYNHPPHILDFGNGNVIEER